MLKRGFLLYLIFILLTVPFVDYKGMINNARLKSLNRVRPDLAYLIDFDTSTKSFEPALLNQYLHYYTKVARYFPNQSDANGILGVLYYYAGNYEESEKAYLKEMELSPRNFWHFHNLGGLYYQQKRLKEAQDILYKAVVIPLDNTFLSILTSSVYQQIIHDHKGFDKSKVERLFNGYRRVYTMLILINQQNKDYMKMFNTTYGAVNSGIDDKGTFLYFAALAAYQMNDFKKAGFLFEESIKKNRNFTESYYYLGMSYEKMGRENESKTALKKSLELKEKGITTEPQEFQFQPQLY